ncbi:hypothetical protein [Cohnella herbarum]|uniref:Uncharacterized protein n=1 Tax=Cohnella herbarum TaxID=2728023 RepID=A0A7Z2ZQC8_9BACL|nr:hypothetical protein [Cohnella herbarum]QJD87860.1 hypothetical protein HH215_34810 [Cohnella herbarum]
MSVTVILPNEEKSTTTPEAKAVLAGLSFPVGEVSRDRLSKGLKTR